MKPKILHINTFSLHGGAEKIAYLLYKNTDNSHLIVKYDSTNDDKILEFEQNTMDKAFKVLTKLKWRVKPYYSFKKIFSIDDQFNGTYNKLKKLEAYKSADIIHLHNIHGGYFDLSALRLIAREKKIVWTLHDMWSITGGEAYVFENENYKQGIGKTPYLNVPPLNSPLIDRRQHFIEFKKKLYKQIAKSIVFVPVSSWLEECLTSSYVWDTELKYRTIKNGIETTVYQNHEIRNNANVILIFNNNNIFKGETGFKQVLEKIKVHFELIVVGNELVIENTYCTGITHLPFIREKHKLAALFNQVNILLFPSKADNLPLLPMEAMSCGVCVIASNVGGIPEIIEHTRNGFLFNKISELEDLLNQLLEQPEKVAAVGNAAIAHIKNEFNIEHMFEKYNNLYDDIINDKI